MENLTIVTLILARGGSKGVPRKNVKPLAGKPLIAYSILPSLQSKLIHHTFVSTEDEEIAQISKNLGAKIIPQPWELAQDNISDMPVLQFAINYLEQNQNIHPDIIVFLRPTQPLRTVEDIDRAIRKMLETRAGSVHTVHLVTEHPYWMNRVEGDKLKDFVPGGWNYQQRQLLPNVYKSNGLVDVMKRDLIMNENKKRCSRDQRAVITETERGVDIDTELDFLVAEKLLEKREMNLNLKKAVFLDRDGVINHDPKRFVRSCEEFSFLPRAKEAIKQLNGTDFKVIVVTNQSGIAFGKYTENILQDIHQLMQKELSQFGASIDAIYYCPHHQEGLLENYRKNCQCQKPNPGMLLQAAKEHDLELKNSFIIGDKTSDIAAGKRAGCKTILVKTGYGGSDKACEVEPDYIVEDLKSAVDLISE